MGDTMPDDVRALVKKARALQEKVDKCEQQGGHEYTVQGFSAIAHPEVMFPPYRPNVPSVTEGITFSSYYCTRCGNRVTPEEGRAYMAVKYREESHRRWVRENFGQYDISG